MDIWIGSITPDHNGSTCLLKNGELVFYIEEDRLSRLKYEGVPFAGLDLIRKYTDRLDRLVISHYGSLDDYNPTSILAKTSHIGLEDFYTAYARKIGLIDKKFDVKKQHYQVYDAGVHHHIMHATNAFINSGFDEANVLVSDNRGSYKSINKDSGVETETILFFTKHNFTEIFKRVYVFTDDDSFEKFYSDRGYYYSNSLNICRAYEQMVEYCGFNFLEAGKAMGLAPYGKPDSNIPSIFEGNYPKYRHNKEFYKNGQLVINDYLKRATLEIKQNFAYSVQKQCEDMMMQMIQFSVQKTDCKNVIVTGGFGLNCSANYQYRKRLPKDINLYCEPISHDGGTSIGAARFVWNTMYKSSFSKLETLYLGPSENLNYNLKDKEQSFNVTKQDVVRLLLEQKLICIFQSKSEAGPRALGNRSILFDPRVPNGKDIVNRVKKREWFRPFAGTILLDYVHDWFDMAGLEESPFMMYAVDTLEDKRKIIPSIVHVDGTCRIQTVTKKQNLHFYELIEEFYKQTSVPILFNTSFNLAGEPLVETIDDALETLRNSDLEYLYLPEINKMIRVPNV